jgi:hypothetical protein
MEGEMRPMVLALIVWFVGLVSAEELPVQSVSIFTGAWIIEFMPSGSARAQYGSSPGDGGYVAEGTVDFTALVKNILATSKKEKTEHGDKFQVAVRYEGQISVTAFVLSETSFLERILGDLESKWKGGARFDKLREKYPIVQKTE